MAPASSTTAATRSACGLPDILDEEADRHRHPALTLSQPVPALTVGAEQALVRPVDNVVIAANVLQLDEPPFPRERLASARYGARGGLASFSVDFPR